MNMFDLSIDVDGISVDICGTYTTPGDAVINDIPERCSEAEGDIEDITISIGGQDVTGILTERFVEQCENEVWVRICERY